jgi:hypothetical protein
MPPGLPGLCTRPGPGPTTLAFATAESESAVIDALETVLGGSGVVQSLSVDFEGLR